MAHDRFCFLVGLGSLIYGVSIPVYFCYIQKVEARFLSDNHEGGLAGAYCAEGEMVGADLRKLFSISGRTSGSMENLRPRH